MIVGIDINPDREASGAKFGMTHFVNPKDFQSDIVQHLVAEVVITSRSRGH